MDRKCLPCLRTFRNLRYIHSTSTRLARAAALTRIAAAACTRAAVFACAFTCAFANVRASPAARVHPHHTSQCCVSKKVASA